MNIKFSHRVMAIFLAFTFMNTIVPYNLLYASNNGPKTPEASGFEPVDATDMVSLLTGDLSYVIPLLSVPGPEGGYPLSLSYHGGVAMDQQASWVGLGWNLNPGAINRNVNGYPDDWETSSEVQFFHDEGQETIHSLSIGYGIAPGDYTGSMSIATNFSWGSNRSLSGEVSLGFGPASQGGSGSVNVSAGTNGGSVGIGYGYSNGLNVGGSLGSNGYSVNAGYSNGGQAVGLNFSSSFEGESNIGGTFSSSISKGKSLDWSLSSGGVGLKYNNTNSKGYGVGTGVSVQFNQTLSQGSYDVKRTGWKIPLVIPTPAGTFSFSYGKQKIKYELNNEEVKRINGVLYSGEFENPVSRYAVRGYNMDYTGVDTIPGPKWFIVDDINNLPQLGNYEGYQTKIVDDDDKMMDIYEVDIYDNSNGAPQLIENNPTFPNYDAFEVNSQGMSGSIRPRMLETAALQGLETSVDDKLDYSLTYEIPDATHFANDFSTFDRNIHFYFDNDYSSSLVLNPTAYYNNTAADDIFDYLDPSNVEEVMPRKRGSRFVESFTNSELANGSAVAAGFLKANTTINYGNSEMFEQDGIGAFKITASDGKTYHYSLPVYNFEFVNRRFGTIDPNKAENESYFERRQLKKYATHWLLTAVTGADFIDLNNNSIVDDGDYGYWVGMDYGKWSDAYAWRTPYGKDYEEQTLSTVNGTTGAQQSMKYYSWGRKQVYYIDAIKTRTHTAHFIKDLRADDIGHVINHNAVRPDKVHYSVDVPAQQLLRLNTIVLTQNDKVTSLDKYNDNGNLIDNPGRSVSLTWQEKTNSGFQNLQNNVLDVHDLTPSELRDLYENAIKVVDLGSHFDYSLANDSPNSNAVTPQNQGRLTLNGITYKGKGNTQLLPSYLFDYYDLQNFNLDQADDWGFNKDHPHNWSLKEITTPQGGKIQISYDKDLFSQTSVINDGNSFNVDTVERSIQPSDNTLTVYFDVEDRIGVNVQDKIQLNYKHECFAPVQAGQQPDPNVDPLFTWNYGGLATIQNISANGIAMATSDGQATCVGGGCSNTDVSCNGETEEVVSVRSVDGTFYEREGGGIRVKEIVTTDGLDVYKTKYDYSKNITYTIGGVTQNEVISSGIVSYVPHEEELATMVPFASELPPPVVMYEFVTSQSFDKNDTPASGKTRYHFQVMNPDNFLDIVNLSSENGFSGIIPNQVANARVNIKNHLIVDYMASIGRILSIENFNKSGQLLQKTENKFKEFADISQGVVQESFQTYKIIDYDPYTDINGNQADQVNDWIINSSTRKIYPNVLESSTVTGGGVSTTTYFDVHDVNSGEVLETTTISSNGVKFKSKTVPAYSIFEYSGNSGGFGMGSKVDNPTNKNMLTQQAASLSYINDNSGQEKIVASKINTWNNDWGYRSNSGLVSSPTDQAHKVWRSHKSYVWKGDIDSDGVYQGFSGNYDEFDWTVNIDDSAQPDEWQKISETTLYDHYSMPLESKDINGNYVSTKMDKKAEKIVSTSNAGYTEQFYSGAEEGNPGDVGGEVNLWNPVDELAHTGVFSEKAGVGSTNFRATITPKFNANQIASGITQERYKMSVWVHKYNYSMARLFDGSGIIEFSGEKVFAGDWVQLNHYLSLSGPTEVYVTSDNGFVYFDDFRVHPVQSSMSSYVYNDWDELTHIISANNMATLYEYDETGRLSRIYSEVANTPSFNGGFKLSSEFETNYARQVGSQGSQGGDIGITNLESYIYYSPGTPGDIHFTGTAIGITGGSGNFDYQWSYSVQGGNYISLTTTSSPSLNYVTNTLNDLICGEQVRLRCKVIDQVQTGLQSSIEGGYDSINCNQ